MILGIEWGYWVIGGLGLLCFIFTIRADIKEVRDKKKWVEKNFNKN